MSEIPTIAALEARVARLESFILSMQQLFTGGSGQSPGRGTPVASDRELDSQFGDDTIRFDPKDCDSCSSRARCTTAALGRGRTISIHPEERMLIELRALRATSDGRKDLRERVGIEHALAHVGRRQGPRARYIGARKNVFDIRRTCAVENLVTLDRPLLAAAA